MSTNNCPNCAPYDCYHICPNSPFYYSAEQERADEPFYGDDDVRERYAGELIGLEGEPDYEGEVVWEVAKPSFWSDDLPF